MSSPDALPMLDGFRSSEQRLRVRLARLGAWLAILLVLSGSLLDYLTYPEKWLSFLQLRILCVCLLGVVTTILYSNSAQRFGMCLAFLLGVLPAFCVAALIYLANGTRSPYYAGLILILVAVTQLLQSFREALVYSLLLIGSYCIACVANDGASPPGMFGVNLAILTMTGGVCVVVCDLNASRRFHEFGLAYDLERKQRELTELDRLKTQFFTNVSHELRTPLTLILAPVESLLHSQPPLPQSVGQQLHMVQRNGLRLLALINDLLDIVRVEQCRVELNRRRLSVAQLVAGVVDTMRESARQAGIGLDLQRDALRIDVLGDEMRLERVFLNLLSNAIKFTPEGGQISLRVSRQDEWACIQVQDTGAGIHADDLPRIFDRYYQVRDETFAHRQGLGIGLHLTRELVEAHGGSISVVSKRGQGSTFTVLLPAIGTEAAASPVAEPPHPADAVAGFARPAAEQVAAAEHIADVEQVADAEQVADPEQVADAERALGPADVLLASADAAAGDDPQRPTVLVIDDEPDMRQFLVSILQAKYTVFSAPSAERGIEFVKQHAPDLVLLDLMLPGMDGLEACGRLRAWGMPQDTKILMLTAKIDEGTKITALRRGADDFLNKPFNTVEVLTRAEKLLQTSRLQAALRSKNQQLEATLVQLQQAEAQLIQTEKMSALGGLAAGLLHEINNPLNYALLAVQVAERSTRGDADLCDSLRDAREGIKRVSDIIVDLRAFAHPDQSRQHRAFLLSDAIATAARFTAHDLADVDLTLPDTPLPPIFGSRTQISQVLVNLIANGIYAAREVCQQRRPAIAIQAAVNHRFVTVRVRDNGVGIPPANLSRIFDPFFTTKPVGKGIGLGLSVCHTIIRQHGGSLEVTSELGAGTEFSFTVPLVEPSDRNHDH